MRFDAQREELLHDAVERLGGVELLKRAGVAIGGGTVLAARWDHRASTDIDLFMSMDDWMDVREDVADRLGEYGDMRFSMHPGVVTCDLDDGREFSLGGSGSVMAAPFDSELETTTGFRTHATAEILGRKIRARMVNASRYLIRDAYDVACCAKHDPAALRAVLGRLQKQERDAVAYDGALADLKLDATKPLTRPRYSKLADPDVLRGIVFEVVAGRLVPEKLRELTRTSSRNRGGPSR